MAKNLQPGESVYVPWARVASEDEKPYAITDARVLQVHKRSVELDVPGMPNPLVVASSAVHKRVGILVIRIGDHQTESTLLDPLAKSVLQFSRLLLKDDSVALWEIRTIEELDDLWTARQGVYRHVILIGHGSKSGLSFGRKMVDVDTLQGVFQTPAADAKIFVSLCCKTGYAAFGQKFSMLTSCESIIAPYQSIHGAVASQFCQSFLAFHLLEGRSTTVAFKKAHELVPNKMVMRLWQQGEMK